MALQLFRFSLIRITEEQNVAVHKVSSISLPVVMAEAVEFHPIPDDLDLDPDAEEDVDSEQA